MNILISLLIKNWWWSRPDLFHHLKKSRTGPITICPEKARTAGEWWPQYLVIAISVFQNNEQRFSSILDWEIKENGNNQSFLQLKHRTTLADSVFTVSIQYNSIGFPFSVSSPRWGIQFQVVQIHELEKQMEIARATRAHTKIWSTADRTAELQQS